MDYVFDWTIKRIQESIERPLPLQQSESKKKKEEKVDSRLVNDDPMKRKFKNLTSFQSNGYVKM